MNRLFYRLFSCLLLGCLFSCSKQNEVTTPSNKKMLGTIQTWDDKTNSINDGSGIQVRLLNYNNQTVTTDATGKYVFDNLPYGQYQLEISKTGYGTYRVYNVTHDSQTASANGFTVVPSISFGKKSTTEVTNLAVVGNTYNGGPGVSFSYNVTPVPTTSSKAFVRFFFSTDPNVSQTNYQSFSPVLNFSNLSNVPGFTNSDLSGFGFLSGQTVYVRMYGESFIPNAYIDSIAQRWIFPNINTNTTSPVTFQVP